MSFTALITDLDNTLYDWVGFYVPAFKAMVHTLESIIGVPQKQLLDEFRVVHQRYANIETPFAALELPSVQAMLRGMTRAEMKDVLDPAFHAFNAERKGRLQAYESVVETLEHVKQRNLRIIGLTDAAGVNAVDRLGRLGLLAYFDRVYARSVEVPDHPDGGREARSSVGAIAVDVPGELRKPDAELLRYVCASEAVPLGEAFYIGDSLARDVAMAKAAGVFSIWARYGEVTDRESWNILVAVTHWTEDDLERERTALELVKGARPDVQVDAFSDVLEVLEYEASR